MVGSRMGWRRGVWKRTNEGSVWFILIEEELWSRDVVGKKVWYGSKEYNLSYCTWRGCGKVLYVDRRFDKSSILFLVSLS